MKFRFAIISFFVLDILLLAVWLSGNKNQNYKTSEGTQNYPEAEEISAKFLNFPDLKKYFVFLAQNKGAKYAYEVLRIASLPPNTDTHLLGHAVGDILYREQGANGIQICTEDFRNACSHSIVVGLFTDKGEDALSEIENACQKAPGGTGAYIMCYHGLGHGILAYEGYDLQQTINLCKKTGSLKYNNQEYPECVSGSVMEIISGGGHDRDKWIKQRPNYLNPNDPFYICSPPLMPEAARSRCYDYVTPYLWETVGADLGNPTNEDLKKSFKLCDQIVEENYRNICYGGFGKEFVGLVASRDIRRVDQMDEGKLKKIVGWCNLAYDKQGIKACLGSALSSIYWGGENDRSSSIRFCKAIDESENQKYCFQNLISQVFSYIKDPRYLNSFCEEIPDEFTSECEKRLVEKN